MLNYYAAPVRSCRRVKLHFFAQGPLEWLWRRLTLISAGKSRITDNAR
ncbi:DUF418 domain-containing protein [Pantoea agglomerans]|nr:DUF418 domain-containing protein [Pantoea agglomerans]